MPMQSRRSLNPGTLPVGLAEGQLFVGLADTPTPSLWVGVPTAIDPSGARLIAPTPAPQLKVTMQVLKTSGTYTPPAGLQAAIVECVGAGGAGGGAAAGQNGGAGGGGSGNYARAALTAAQIGASQTVTVGAGGAGGTGNGGNGGPTSFGTLVRANGGNGAPVLNPTSQWGTPGNAGVTTGDVGDFVTLGNDGNVGIWLYDGSALYAVPGSGGSTLFGGTASLQIAPGPSLGGNGNPAGANTGGGGSGAWSVNSTINRSGGSGGSGVCIVTEFAM